MIKKYLKYILLLSVFNFSGNIPAAAQGDAVTVEDYNTLQAQSLELVEKYKILLTDIVSIIRSNNIVNYYDPGSPKQIFQDRNVMVANEVESGSKAFLTVEVKNYLDYWYALINSNLKSNKKTIKVDIIDIFVSPVFVESKSTYTRVYFRKKVEYPDTTVIRNEFMVIRSIRQHQGWSSLIAGIDLLNDRTQIDAKVVTKRMPSINPELGTLLEKIYKKRTVIEYSDYSQSIAASGIIGKYKDFLDFSYSSVLNASTVSHHSDSIRFSQDTIRIFKRANSALINKNGYKLEMKNHNLIAESFDPGHIRVERPGFNQLSIDNSEIIIDNTQGIKFISSGNSEHLEFYDSIHGFNSIYVDNQVVDMTHQVYQLSLNQQDNRIRLIHDNIDGSKIISSSGSSFYNMVLITAPGVDSLTDLYVDKTEVTVSQFYRFILETGYITEVEKRGWSYILDEDFKMPKKYKPSPGTGVSVSLGLVKGYGVKWNCNEYGKMLDIKSQDTNRPVIHISYYDALQFSKWAGKSLPMVKEMKYVSRDILEKESQGNFAIYAENSGRLIQNTMQKQANIMGLYDVLGNVYEWCTDWDVNQPESEKKNILKMVFGGSFVSVIEEIRLASEKETACNGSCLIGFRCVVRKEKNRNL